MRYCYYFLIAFFLCCEFSKIKAQVCNVPMCVIVDPDFSNLTQEASSALNTQLQRVATKAGLDIAWINSNFAITAKFDQIDRYVVGGAPAQIANSFGVTLYVADVYNKNVFASTYFEVKGVGPNETKASMDAIRRLNSNNSTIQKFFADSKQKIINYYDSRISVILKEAEAKASMKQYEDALSTLAVVPSCCSGYEKAMSAAKNFYTLYRDEYFQKQVNVAKALWAANPTVSGSKEAVRILSLVDPDAKCYSEAMELLGQIAKVVKSDIDYEVKKKYEDSIELERLRIQAIAEIGKAHAANQPKVNVLFLGNGTGVSSVSASHPISSEYMQQSGFHSNSVKLSGPEIYQKYGQAVFTILVPSEDGTMTSQGSGFFIDTSGLAVTNYHVLEEGDLKRASIAIPGSNTTFGINNIRKANKENDFVVFSVNCSNNTFIPIASKKPNVGEKVYAIGSPKGFQNTFSSGEVSQWRGDNLMQTTVMIDHGSSGGALINEYGEVVGITSGTLDSKSVANLNYAISIDAIK